MATVDDIRKACEQYIEAVGAGDAAAIAALYADDATVTDPAGSEPHVGIDAVRAFYESVSAPGLETKLINGVNVVNETLAAFHFAVVVDGNPIVEPIDVMTFDADGKITSMTAYWSM
jgi:steroid delta-isomerase